MITPAKIAKRTLKAMRGDSLRLFQRALAPNDFTIHLPAEFMEHWRPFISRLENELAGHLAQAITKTPDLEAQAPVKVRLVADANLMNNRLLIDTCFTRPPAEPARLVEESRALDMDFPLIRPVTVIGRGEVDLRLPPERAYISRRHARVLSNGPEYLLEDMDSRQGTFLNERKIERGLLTSGDRITIGDITLVFSLRAALGGSL